ncbi:hypothetical protein Droror1_Dr00012960 [Drosera rotundifolia]
MRLKKQPCDFYAAPSQSERTIRAAGQRSLPSTRNLPRPDPSSEKKPSPISLSEYLARKLHSTQEKQDKAPLSTSRGDKGSSIGCGNRLLPQQCGTAKDKGSVIDDSVFKQFRHATPRDENDMGIGLCDEALTKSSSGAREQESRKRKNTFTGISS